MGYADDASLIETPANFDFVFAVRKYVGGTMVAGDKCPNRGYFTFSNGTVSSIDVISGQPTEKLQTTHSSVFYNRGNDRKAKWYGEAFECAYVQLGVDLGAYPAQQFKLYTYLTQDDLVLGLQLYSGFSSEDANFFKTGGAPRPINYIMHVAPDGFYDVVAHELTHTVIEEISGTVYKTIKWLDEGLACYEAYVTTVRKYDRVEFASKADSMRRVYEALDSGKLFTLRELSSETDWGSRMYDTSENALQYAEAWILVNYLAVTYGLSKCKSILLAMKQGQTQESAIQNSLAVSMTQLETNFKQYLQKIRGDAPVHISEAEAAIQKAENEKRTVGLNQAKSLIEDAKDANASGDYERAITLADQAKELASRATFPQIGQVPGAILNAQARTVYFTRTGNMYDDSALGFIYSKCTNQQNIIIQTDSTKINQTTGAPLFTGNMVLFGGRAANKVVRRYEGLGYAIITFSANTTHYRFMKGSSPVYTVAISTHSPSREDYFIVQVYMDGSRTVFSMWGFEKEGTYASGVYFADTIYPNLATYTQSYYICKWTDTNNDGIQQSNEITIVASGT